MTDLNRIRFAPDEQGSALAGTVKALPPDAVIILPVRTVVLFPGVVFPISVGRPRSVAAAQEAIRQERQVGILMQRDESVADPSAVDLHRVGTMANILRDAGWSTFWSAITSQLSCHSATRSPFDASQR